MAVEGPTPPQVIPVLVELHQAARKMVLYPPTHALIPKAIDSLAQRFEALWPTHPTLTVDVGAKHLLLAGEPLDPQNPVLKELTHALSSAHVARMTVRQGVDHDGLSRLLVWLKERNASPEARQQSLAALHQAVPAIEIALVSFRHATADAQGSASRGDTWSQLLDALLEAGLEERSPGGAPGGETPESQQPERLAELINRASTTGDSGRYERLVLEHLQRLAAPLHDPATGDQRAAPLPEAERKRLATLVERLDPPVRERLFRLAFAPDSPGPGALAAILADLSEPVLLEVLSQIQSHGGTISIPTLELLRKFVGLSREQPALAPSIAERLDGLELADRHALYAELFHKKTEKNFYPDSYAKTIKGLSGTAPAFAAVAHEPIGDLVDPVDEAQIHRHLAIVMTELLELPAAAPSQAALIERLGQALEDPLVGGHPEAVVGVFEAIRACRPANPEAKQAFDKTLARMVAPVVRAIPKIDKARAAAIADHLVAIGEPIVAALLEILNAATDPGDMVLRKRLLDVLARIGRPIAPAVLPWLKDERWFILRNMIFLLGEARVSEVLPKLKPFATHAHEQVRLEALRALGSISPPEALLDTLAVGVQDKDDRVASCAISLLLQRPTPATVERLRQIYHSRASRLSETRKLKIIEALGRSNEPACVAFLSRLARRRRFILFDLPKDAVVRKAAREALRRRRLKVSERQSAEEHGRAA
ncbi:MAG: HEAT repeat domain-containing protein [Nitrospirota bacterium]